MKNVLVFDYGASSGRGILVTLDNGKLILNEVHRFGNNPKDIDGSFCWDIDVLFSELKAGIASAMKICNHIDSIGIDTWGVDFVALDKAGNRLGSAIHYRDKRTENKIDEAGAVVSGYERYKVTGIAQMSFNSLYQLMAQKDFDKTENLMYVSDYFGYLLTGNRRTEWTIASTSETLQVGKPKLAQSLLNKFNIPTDKFPPFISAGEVLGNLNTEIAAQLGIDYPLPIIAVCQHDTASAVMAIPTLDKDFAYISSGTWSLLGTELSEPNTTEEAYKAKFTNEIGYNGSVRFLNNIMGLWLIQECRRVWLSQGKRESFAQIADMATTATPFKALIDVNDASFLKPDNMITAIDEYLLRTKQPQLRSVGEYARCVFESLALEYAEAIQSLEKITGKTFTSINIIGGGSNNNLLNEMTANANNKKVVAGVGEATAVGNALAQLIGLKQISTIEEARSLSISSFPLSQFEPRDTAAWAEQRVRYAVLTTKK